MNGTDLCPRCGVVMARHGSYGSSRVNCEFRDESDLTPQLIEFEGWRVQAIALVQNEEGNTVGEMRRFYVGRSTGWRPCHLEIQRRDSLGGSPAAKEYESVDRLYRRGDYKLRGPHRRLG